MYTKTCTQLSFHATGHPQPRAPSLRVKQITSITLVKPFYSTTVKKLKINFAKRINILAMLPFMLMAFMGVMALCSDDTNKADSTTYAALGAVGMSLGVRKHIRLTAGETGGNGGEEALAKKLNEMIEKSMTETEKKIRTEMDELRAQCKSATSQTELDAFKKALGEKHDEFVGAMQAKLEKANSGMSAGKTLGEALTLAFAEKKSEIDEIVKNGGTQTKSLKLEVKAVGTISVESTIGAGATQVSITQNTGLIVPIRKRELVYLAHVSVGGIGTNRAMWIEETDEEGTPIMLGEGDAKTQLDVQYVEQTMAVKKIAVYGKVTTELMADIPQLISYIQNNLMKRMDIVLENQYFFGNGVGDNLKGIDQYAQAFDAGTLAASIPDANELDVIEAIALQVKRNFFMPNCLFIHPDTMAKIKLIKDSNGRPIWKDYVTTDGFFRVSGMDIVETTAITAGSFIGGDMTVVHVLKRDELGITIGLDGNDFTQNKKTMLCEKRMVQFVSANEVNGLVDGTFAAAIADINS